MISISNKWPSTLTVSLTISLNLPYRAKKNCNSWKVIPYKKQHYQVKSAVFMTSCKIDLVKAIELFFRCCCFYYLCCAAKSQVENQLREEKLVN